MAEEATTNGYAAFSSGHFTSAILHFTEAINLAPTNHLLYSIRSASHASLHQYADALSDAKAMIKLKPYWPKGYIRLGAAHIGLNQLNLAVTAYKKGLDIDPTNEALKSGLAHAETSLSPSPNSFGEAFKGRGMWSILRDDPWTTAFLEQPDYVSMLEEIQKNPTILNLYLNDQRVMQSVGVLLNVNFWPPPPPPGDGSQEVEKKERKEKAEKEKELGNAAYTKTDFVTAIEHYSKAIEIDDEDISYITNRAAIYLEMGEYNECIKDCDKALERGRELRSDYKMIARALTTKGTALTKMVNCSKDYEPAIEAFHKALTEHDNYDTWKRLNDAERAKIEWKQKEYVDPKIADEEREKGV